MSWGSTRLWCFVAMVLEVNLGGTFGGANGICAGSNGLILYRCHSIRELRWIRFLCDFRDRICIMCEQGEFVFQFDAKFINDYIYYDF